MPSETQARIRRERFTLLHQLDRALEKPMVIFGLVWLVLLVLDWTRGLSPMLSAANTTIWILFVFEFPLKLLIAPAKLAYLRKNWLLALSLVAPGFRLLRVARVVRAAQATRTV